MVCFDGNCNRKTKHFEAVCKTAPALNIIFSLLICEIYGCFLICEICEICGLYCFCFSGLSRLGFSLLFIYKYRKPYSLGYIRVLRINSLIR